MYTSKTITGAILIRLIFIRERRNAYIGKRKRNKTPVFFDNNERNNSNEIITDLFIRKQTVFTFNKNIKRAKTKQQKQRIL